MDKINFKKFSLQKLKQIKNKYFKELNINEKDVFDDCKKHIDYYIQNNLDVKCQNGLKSIVMYLLSKSVVDGNEYSLDDLIRVKNQTIAATTNYISPFSNIGFPLIIYGNYNYIGGGYNLDNNISIGNNNRFYDNNYNVFDKYINIGKNVKIADDVRIYQDIGDNCSIDMGCVIKENIPPNSVVEVKNNVQIKTTKVSNYLPSQTLNCFGCVPKFKNILVVYGEGFYNPKVKFVVPYGVVDFSINYWDKNKIILKLNDVKLSEKTNKTTLILFSNGQRISLINDLGVIKALKSLKK